MDRKARNSNVNATAPRVPPSAAGLSGDTLRIGSLSLSIRIEKMLGSRLP